MKFKFLVLFLAPVLSFSQDQNLKRVEMELIAASNKLFSFYQDYEPDSLQKYSDELRIRMIKSLSNNPATLKYPFKTLIDSSAFLIATSEDSLFRIYSWDKWTGGSLHYYENIYQYSFKKSVTTSLQEFEEGDGGGYFSEIFSLNAGNKTYYLVVGNSRFSNKDHAQSIQVFAIEDGKLNKKVNLIKTSSGMTNYIGFEYNFFSVVNRPERPMKLIKYDKSKKIIYLPVVHNDGTVTNKFIQYKFNGKYFEKYKIQ